MKILKIMISFVIEHCGNLKIMKHFLKNYLLIEHFLSILTSNVPLSNSSKLSK